MFPVPIGLDYYRAGVMMQQVEDGINEAVFKEPL